MPYTPPNSGKLALGVLISGRGSNLDALIQAAQDPGYPCAIRIVISNRKEAPGLERARAAGLATATLPHREFPDREAFEAAVSRALIGVGVELVVLAGFMRVLSAGFVRHWQDRLINIHPSLLPSFPGLDTHRRALAAGVALHGCTVHAVVPEVDAGPPIMQGAVPVRPGDSEAELAARVLAVEHRILPEALRRLGSGAVRLEDGKVVHRVGTHAEAKPLIAPLLTRSDLIPASPVKQNALEGRPND